MASAVDYAGRTVDVSAFAGQQAGQQGEVRLAQTLAQLGKGGEIIAGVIKLAQRWMIEFLTSLGSIKALPARGCEFMPLLRQGQLRTSLDAEQAFHLAARRVRINLVQEEADTDPDDERFVSADLTSLAVSGDQLTLRVEVVSRAGTTRKVILPLPVALS